MRSSSSSASHARWRRVAERGRSIPAAQVYRQYRNIMPVTSVAFCPLEALAHDLTGSAVPAYDIYPALIVASAASGCAEVGVSEYGNRL